jgi:hypothetical protein
MRTSDPLIYREGGCPSNQIAYSTAKTTLAASFGKTSTNIWVRLVRLYTSVSDRLAGETLKLASRASDWSIFVQFSVYKVAVDPLLLVLRMS